jgi:hypothetical protein
MPVEERRHSRIACPNEAYPTALDQNPDQSLSMASIESTLRRNSPSVVIGGHYSLSSRMQELSCQGEAEEASFAPGARLVTNALSQKADSYLILWINDIAIPLEQRADLKSDYRLPSNYRTTLKQIDFPEHRLVVMFESTMRNKASVLLRKLYNQQPTLFERVDSRATGLIRCVEDVACSSDRLLNSTSYTVAGPNGERLVVKDGPNPKCSLILATLFQQLAVRFNCRLQINIFNEIYTPRILLGTHVFRHLLRGSVPMINVFCDGNEVVSSE